MLDTENKISKRRTDKSSISRHCLQKGGRKNREDRNRPRVAWVDEGRAGGCSLCCSSESDAALGAVVLPSAARRSQPLCGAIPLLGAGLSSDGATY